MEIKTERLSPSPYSLPTSQNESIRVTVLECLFSASFYVYTVNVSVSTCMDMFTYTTCIVLRLALFSRKGVSFQFPSNRTEWTCISLIPWWWRVIWPFFFANQQGRKKNFFFCIFLSPCQSGHILTCSVSFSEKPMYVFSSWTCCFVYVTVFLPSVWVIKVSRITLHGQTNYFL